MSTPRIAIIGKGALGLLYGSMAADALGGEAVTYVMDPERLARHAGDSYTVNGSSVSFRDASPEDAGPQDMVMIATKAYDLDGALDLVEPLLGPDTVIVSVLNGITSEGRVAARFGWERVVPCVAQGMDATHYGSSLTYSQPGELHVGLFPNTPQEELDRAVAIFTAAGIDHVVEADIRLRMWAKFMLNVGVNQTCAVYGVTYGELNQDQTAEPFRTYVAAMREVEAVAHAEGVLLTEADLTSYVELEKGLDPSSTPSMGQDRINRKPTEVDEFSGEVMRRAAKHNILVPANAFLNQRMHQIEREYL